MSYEEEYSTCCGAGRLYDESDLCADCKEHTDFDDGDPTPWCTYCLAMVSTDCDCGPIAEND